jgi:sigma-B regulation protein RsbU (phosphoserine phosphatase)
MFVYMDTNLLQTFITLFEMICVVIVFAYLFTRSRFFTEVLEHHPTIITQVLLAMVFGLLSIFGLTSGITLSGAVVNIRDLGPLLAGFICGPYVGLGAGLIGGAYRLTLGGGNVYLAAAGPVMAGLAAGLVYYFNKREMVSVKAAVLLTIAIEVFVSVAALINRVFNNTASQILPIFINVALPMIVLTSIAVAIFAFIVHNLIKERRTQKEKESLEREMARKDAELQIAAEIQRSFLPETIPDREGFDIAGTSIPAKEVGGDFFDVMPFEVIPFDRTKTGVMIADVSGKGVPAALFMALSRIVVRVSATWFENTAEAIAFANPIIARDSKTGMFVTLFYGVLDIDAKKMTYVNAGHNPPVLLHAGTDNFEELELTGMAIGAMDDSPYEQREVHLRSGDILTLYTDGVTEAVNGKNELFDVPRLLETIRINRDKPSKEIMDAIITGVFAFSAGQPQFDDITLMVVKVK